MRDFGDSVEARSMSVRPYTVTGGRTESPPTIVLESMVSVNPRNPVLPAELVPELYRIMDLSARPTAVVEVSAHLGLPVQVTKILVGDLVGAGHLVIHASSSVNPEQRPDLKLLDRVLDGLHRL